MKKIKIVFAIATVMLLSACVKEQDLTPDCGKWQIEINNPEATVKVENGHLIVDIPNPKTEKDVRLIQYQNKDHNSAEIGAWVQLPVFKVGSVDAQMKSSFAYQAKPEESFVSVSISGHGKRGYYNGEEVFVDLKGGLSTFYGEAEVVKFAVSHAFNSTVEVPFISSAPKIYYLDFGVKSFGSRSYPSEFLHAEIDLVFFGDHVDSQGVVSGFNQETLGFKNDLFDCNSID